MAASLNSQGITQWPETWARVVHAGDINSGAVAEADNTLQRRKREHARAHKHLFGAVPRPTNMFGQQDGYQDFLSAAERRSKPCARRGQGRARWVGPSLRRRSSGASAGSDQSVATGPDALARRAALRVGEQMQTGMCVQTEEPLPAAPLAHSRPCCSAGSDGSLCPAAESGSRMTARAAATA